MPAVGTARTSLRAAPGHVAGVRAHLRNHAKVLWSPSYSAAWVGYVSASTVRRHIRHQWDAVMAS